ncbi:hypothetical protein [Microbulbifer halophilus]|uniref:Uncharacterized protein n=1 Tax=Microbulbifer halophilus TaxID=453963 RepID=A0ABW5E8E6_9GAMM|nr:hypothetical protein [Microbulbifer halophilus]MCW8125527.1 hypothetical protein [Microbulbifer halophilus]
MIQTYLKFVAVFNEHSDKVKNSAASVDTTEKYELKSDCMKAYRLVNDYDSYQTLQLDTIKIVEQLGRPDLIRKIKRMTSTGNTPLIDIWGDVKSTFAPMEGTQSVKIPDVSVWKGAGLLFSGRAHAYFKLMLEPFGEFLPVEVEGHDFYLFHLMTEGKVDLDSSSREDDEFGEPMTVTALKFDDSDIEDKLLFKSEYEFYQAPFCNQKFKELYQEYDLEGLIFEEDLTSMGWR